jgi:hypothetical protein
MTSREKTRVKGSLLLIRSMTSGFPPDSFGLTRNPRQSSEQQPGMSHGVRCRPTMFTKQVSRPVDRLDLPFGRRAGACRANSRKDLVTARSEVLVPHRLLNPLSPGAKGKLGDCPRRVARLR